MEQAVPSPRFNCKRATQKVKSIPVRRPPARPAGRQARRRRLVDSKSRQSYALPLLLGRPALPGGFPVYRTCKSLSHETHFSAQQHQAQAPAWFPCAHENAQRPPDPQAPACKRPPSSQRVTAIGRGFSRDERLLDSAAFAWVFERAENSRDRYFTVLGRRRGDRGARLGLAVSRRALPLATARNHLKRLIRESFRHHKELLDGIDVVVLPRRACTDADNKEIFAALERHWQRISRKCARS